MGHGLLGVDRVLAEDKPLAIVLFDSDIDLLIVEDVQDERAAAVRYGLATRPSPIPADILVMSPNTFGRRVRRKDPLARDVLTQGEVLVGNRGMVNPD